MNYRRVTSKLLLIICIIRPEEIVLVIQVWEGEVNLKLFCAKNMYLDSLKFFNQC